MSLDMSDFIDPVFESVPASRTKEIAGSFVDGKWVDGTIAITNHTVNIQPASDREIQSIERGGERIVDARRIFINDGIDASISQADIWEFLGQKWKCHAVDNRPWRNYCKAIVSRIDQQ